MSFPPRVVKNHEISQERGGGVIHGHDPWLWSVRPVRGVLADHPLSQCMAWFLFSYLLLLSWNRALLFDYYLANLLCDKKKLCTRLSPVQIPLGEDIHFHLVSQMKL